MFRWNGLDSIDWLYLLRVLFSSRSSSMYYVMSHGSQAQVVGKLVIH